MRLRRTSNSCDTRFELAEAAPLLCGGVRRETAWSALGETIGKGSDATDEALRTAGLPLHDDFVVLYERGGPGGATLLIGRPIETRDPGADSHVFEVPAGKVATTTVIGPYGQLHAVPDAMRDWCRQHGHTLAGPTWEIYHHLGPDGEASAGTTVQWLLR